MKRVAFREAELPSSGGLVNMARLRTLPSDQKKEMIRRLQARRYRQRLAAIVVEQWKWFARKGLARIQRERRHGRQVLASAWHRRTILSKTFTSLHRYKCDRVHRREVHLADTYFKRRFLITWKREYTTSLTTTLQRYFKHFKALLITRQRRLKLLRCGFRSICEYSKLHKSAVRYHHRLVFLQWASFVRNQRERLLRASSAMLFRKQTRSFEQWKVVTAAERCRRSAILRRGFAAWRAAFIAQRLLLLRDAFSHWVLLPNATLVPHQKVRRLFSTWKVRLLLRRTQRSSLSSHLAALRRAVIVRKIERSSERTIRRRAYDRLTRRVTAARLRDRVQRTMLVTRFHTWRQFVVKKAADRTAHLKLHLAKVRQTTPHSLRPRKARPSPRGLPKGLVLSSPLGRVPPTTTSPTPTPTTATRTRVPLQLIPTDQRPLPSATYKRPTPNIQLLQQTSNIQLVSERCRPPSDRTNCVQLISLKTPNGSDSGKYNGGSCDPIPPPCPREIGTQCDLPDTDTPKRNPSTDAVKETFAQRDPGAVFSQESSEVSKNSVATSTDTNDTLPALSHHRKEGVDTTHPGGVHLLKTLVAELISERMPLEKPAEGTTKEEPPQPQREVQLWDNTVPANIRPLSGDYNTAGRCGGLVPSQRVSRTPSLWPVAVELHAAGAEGAEGVELLPSSTSRQSPVQGVGSFPNSPVADPTEFVHLQPLQRHHRQRVCGSNSSSDVTAVSLSGESAHSSSTQRDDTPPPSPSQREFVVDVERDTRPEVVAKCDPTACDRRQDDDSVRHSADETRPTVAADISSTDQQPPADEYLPTDTLRADEVIKLPSGGDEVTQSIQSDGKTTSGCTCVPSPTPQVASEEVSAETEPQQQQPQQQQPQQQQTADGATELGMEMFAVASVFAETKQRLLLLQSLGGGSEEEVLHCERQHTALRDRLQELRNRLE